jgi:hypothetical protein
MKKILLIAIITMIVLLTVLFVRTAKAQIYHVQAASVYTGATYAEINVITDGELYQNYNCVINYGINSINENSTGTFTFLTNSMYSVGLNNLVPNTTYKYQAVGVSGVYNNDTLRSIDGASFTTTSCQPVSFQNIYSKMCSSELQITSCIEPGFYYQWFLNGDPIPGAVYSNFTAFNSGYYSVLTGNQYCNSYSGSILITIPGLSINIDAPASVCEGDYIQVSASGADYYQWQPAGLFENPTSSKTIFHSDTTVTISVTGVYDDCSQTVQKTITVHQKPQVSISSLPDSICIESNNVITLTGTPEGGNFMGQGVIGNYFDPSQLIYTGTYGVEYQYINTHGCWGNAFKIITVTEPPIVKNISSKNGNVILEGLFKYPVTITIGSTTYQTNAQDEKKATFFGVPLQNGDYVLTQTVGSPDCYVYDEFKYGVGIEEVDGKDKINVYPNPFKDFLNVEIQKGNYQVQLIDKSGKTVQSKTVTGNFTLERGNSSTGIYTLRIISVNGILSEKISIVN